MKSYIILGLALIKHLVSRLTRSPEDEGADVFIDLYKDDGLYPFDIDKIEKSFQRWGCIECGICDPLKSDYPFRIDVVYHDETAGKESLNIDDFFMCPANIIYLMNKTKSLTPEGGENG